jgi:hypothetical protein
MGVKTSVAERGAKEDNTLAAFPGILNASSTISGAWSARTGIFAAIARGYDMDGTGNFGTGDPLDDAAIETPLNVGNDERRMHVRAYNHWVSLLEGRAYPSIEDLTPDEIEDFGPNSVLLDFTGGIDNPAISFLGHRLREACELPADVGSVADIPSRSLLSRLTDHYLQIIANRAPIGFEAEYSNEQGTDIMYRGILMPFSSDDDTIDFIYGVINWKESADTALSDQLQSEVEKALSGAPVARHAPVAPSWADGPSSVVTDEDAPVASLGSDPVSYVESDEGGFAAPTEDDALADWLAAARVLAQEAQASDLRSRSALYRALGTAYDFALIAGDRPDEYQELLELSGITGQPRAPMTPIVKLVFGIGYDKTRLAEYGLILMHGVRANVARGDFQGFVEGYEGGIKGMVSAERALRRPAPKPRDPAKLVERAREITPRGIVESAGDEEFVMLVARRVDAGHVAVIGQVKADDKQVEKALKAMLG